MTYEQEGLHENTTEWETGVFQCLYFQEHFESSRIGVRLSELRVDK